MTTAARPFVKDGIEFDQIAVRGIRVSGFHGVNANEREDGQLFFADVIVHVNTRAAAAGDDLSRTVNYSEIADRTAEVLAGSPFELIEAVAEHIARDLLEIERIECVDVTVHKPQAPLHVEFKDVSVTIRRDLRDSSLSADKRIGSSAGFSDDPLDPGAGPTRDVMDERPAQPVGAVIALGGNIGDVEPTFRDALAALHRVTGIEVRAASPLFRTTPEGDADQPDYLNAVARVHTALAPRELLAACHGIEMLHGRDRSVPGAARTLDLDIISYEGVTGQSDDLTLPHPRAHQRGFVLLPWSHMESEATLPPHGRVTDLARQASFDGVTLVAAQWPHVPAPDALAGSRESSPSDGAAPQSSDGGQPQEQGQVDQPVPSFAPDEPAESAPSAPQQTAQTAQSFPSAPEAEQSAALSTTPVGYAPPAGHVPPAHHSAPSPSPASQPSAAENPVWEPVHEAPQSEQPQLEEPQWEEPQPPAAPRDTWQQPEPHPYAPPQADPSHSGSAADAVPQEQPSAPSDPGQPGVPRRASFGVLRQPQNPADDAGNAGPH